MTHKYKFLISFFKNHGIKAIFLLLLLSAKLQAAIITTTGSGNWSSTVPNAPWPNGTIPQAGDEVIINFGHTLTIDINTTIKSISFHMPSNGSGLGSLSVNQGVKLTITDYLAAPILNGTIKNNSHFFITGEGSIEVPIIHCGNTNSPSGSANAILYLNSDINELVITDQLIITSIYRNSGAKIVNSYFNLTGGTLTVNGTIILSSESSSNVATFDMSNTNGNSYLLLTNEEPFEIDSTGTAIINLSGTGTTVEYDYDGEQVILATTYTNLIISGSGDKTTDDVIVEDNLVINDDATITGDIEIPATAALIYEGSSLQTTGSELKDTMTNDIIIRNSKGVKLNKNFESNGNFKIESGGVFYANEKKISGSGSFIMEDNSTLVITSDEGISNAPNTGEILTAVRNFNPEANYIYKGSNNQVSGDALPAQVKSLSVVDNAVLTLSKSIISEELVIDDQAQLIVPSNLTLTVEGNLKLESSNALVLKSDAQGTASFIDNGQIIGNGTVKVEKYLSTSNAYGWTVASPVQDAGTEVFTGAQGAFYYNALTASWQTYNTGNMEDMKGYWTKFSSNKTLEFNEGVLNTGTKFFENFYRTGFATGNMGWNFIGNPYPSAIKWDDVVSLSENGSGYGNFINTTKLNSAIYISDNDGGYYYYNNGIGNFDGIIPAATAFWVQVNKDYINPSGPVAGAKLTLNNSVRLHHATQNKNQTSNDYIKLSLSNGNGTDETLIRLHSDASNAFDPMYDAAKMLSQNNARPQIYSYDVNDILAINAISNNISEGISIPLGFIAGNSNQLQFSADLTNIDINLSVILEDKLNNTLVNLRDMGSYDFSIDSNEDNERFVLHLMPQNTTVYTQLDDSNFTAYTYENSLYLEWSELNSKIYVLNTAGQLLTERQIYKGFNKIEMNYPSGVYIINVVSEGVNISKKVIIK